MPPAARETSSDGPSVNNGKETERPGRTVPGARRSLGAEYAMKVATRFPRPRHAASAVKYAFQTIVESHVLSCKSNRLHICKNYNALVNLLCLKGRGSGGGGGS